VSHILVWVLAALALLVLWMSVRARKVLTISRARIIHASPAELFPFINDPRLIQRWNPFMESDPAVRVSYGGTREGKDAQWSWEGKKAGIGTATIVSSDPYRRVDLRLDFRKPFHVTNHGSYQLIPRGDATEVVWTVEETALIPRILSSFVNLERVIGGIFDKGLAKLEGLLAHTGAST
jgi:uncharacterized protein YndB with AHSA1/START domain